MHGELSSLLTMSCNRLSATVGGKRLTRVVAADIGLHEEERRSILRGQPPGREIVYVGWNEA